MVLWPTVMVTLGDLGLVHSFGHFTARGGTSMSAMVRLARRTALTQSLYLVPTTLLVAWFGLTQSDVHPLGAGLVLAAVFVPAALMSRYVAAVFQGRLLIRAFFAVRLSMHLAIALALLGVLAFGTMSVWYVVCAYLAGLTFMVLVSLVLPRIEAARREAPSSGKELLPFHRRQFLGFGLRALPGTLYGLEGLFLDQLLLGIFLGPYDLGLYVVALALTSPPRLVAYGIGLTAMPTLTRAAGDRHRAITVRFVGLTFLALLPLTVALVAMMPLILPVVFGDDFKDAVDPARFLVMGSLAFGIRNVLGECMRGARRPGVVSLVEVGTWPFIVAAAVSGTVIGLTGVAIAFLAMQVLSLVALAVLSLVTGGHDPARPP